MEGRTSNRQRRALWKASEDNSVLELISEFGLKWSKIAAFLPGRTGKQVRDRYLNSLKPSIKHDDWIPEEDSLLISLYRKFGNRWCKIATKIPGRTESQVKNRFYAHIKEQIDESQRKFTTAIGTKSHNIEIPKVGNLDYEDESHKCHLAENKTKSYSQLQQEVFEQELSDKSENPTATSCGHRYRTLTRQSRFVDPVYLVGFDKIINFSELIDISNDGFSSCNNFFGEICSLEFK